MKRAAFFLLILFFQGWGAGCAPDLLAPTAVAETASPPSERARVTPASTIPPDGCSRPYADDSIWNTPIDWSTARFHPDSRRMMAAFFGGGKAWIGSDASQYAPNIYFADRSTPLVAVSLRKNRFRDAIDDQVIHYGEPAGTVWLPLPAHALPARGTDGQLVVINVDTGEEWGIFRGEKRMMGWIADGVYRYHIRNSGIPPQGFMHRGAGIGSLAGIVRACEVSGGAIPHAVTLAYDSPCAPHICAANGWPAFIPPFTRTDGEGYARYDIPEGARMVIRPEIPMSAIVDACRGVQGCIVWAAAMQIYGGFIVDNSGHPKTYPEGEATAQWDPAVWSKDMLRHIPPDWYDILDWDTPAFSSVFEWSKP